MGTKCDNQMEECTVHNSTYIYIWMGINWRQIVACDSACNVIQYEHIHTYGIHTGTLCISGQLWRWAGFVVFHSIESKSRSRLWWHIHIVFFTCIRTHIHMSIERNDIYLWVRPPFSPMHPVMSRAFCPIAGTHNPMVEHLRHTLTHWHTKVFLWERAREMKKEKKKKTKNSNW